LREIPSRPSKFSNQPNLYETLSINNKLTAVANSMVNPVQKLASSIDATLQPKESLEIDISLPSHKKADGLSVSWKKSVVETGADESDQIGKIKKQG
jgi:hypothetical protein